MKKYYENLFKTGTLHKRITTRNVPELNTFNKNTLHNAI